MNRWRPVLGLVLIVIIFDSALALLLRYLA